MKIVSANVFLKELPITRPYTIAYHTITGAEMVFLELVLENGLTGIGSANPFKAVVGESPAQTLESLKSGYVEEFIIGQDIRYFNEIINTAAIQFSKQPGTLAAIDIALHDLFGKYLGIPVLDFYGRFHKALPTSITIGIKNIAEMLEEAEEYYKLGFRILKIKTGIDVNADIERVSKLTERFADEVKIRVDANQGYSLAELQKFINSTRNIGLELIEQPLKKGLETELTGLPDADRKKLVADESLTDAYTAFKLSREPKPYGAYNIKLMKSGGIKAARRIAGIAEMAGLETFWGCNDESIVGIAAALHTAYSCQSTRYLDLDGSFDLAKDVVEGGFILKEGYMCPNNLPGLGLLKTGTLI